MSVTVLGQRASEWEFYRGFLPSSQRTINYRKVKNLAEGSFAKIFLVQASHDPSKDWVLKKPKRLGWEQAEREAKILKVLNEQEKREGREYIIQLVAFFKLRDETVMLFPHYQADLFDFTSEKRLTLSQASEVARQLLETAAFLQRQRLIHRDIKPENILVEEMNETLKISLADFGSAICKNESKKREKSFVGTLKYTSPELINSFQSRRGIHPYSFASDIWSIGCSLFNVISRDELFFLDPSKEEPIPTMIDLQYGFARSKAGPISTIPNIDDFPVLRDILVNTLRTDHQRRFSAKDCLSLFEAIREINDLCDRRNVSQADPKEISKEISTDLDRLDRNLGILSLEEKEKIPSHLLEAFNRIMKEQTDKTEELCDG